MPSGLIRSPEEEIDWNRAKEIVRKQYPDKEAADGDGFYALVTTVFKSIRKGHGDERWSDAGMGVDGEVDGSAPSKMNEAILAMLEQLTDPGPSGSEFLLIANNARYLHPGDQVHVLTLMGNSLSHGIVKSISATGVLAEATIRIGRAATVTDTRYPLSQHVFSVALSEDQMKERIEKGLETDQGGSPVTDMSHLISPDASEVRAIRKVVPSMNRHQAGVLWGDIRQFGFSRASNLHRLGADQQSMLYKVLEKANPGIRE